MKTFTQKQVQELVYEIDEAYRPHTRQNILGNEVFNKFLKDHNELKDFETRVYVVNISNNKSQNVLEWADAEFIEESERQGKIYTLPAFQIAFNLDDVDSRIQYIRILIV